MKKTLLLVSLAAACTVCAGQHEEPANGAGAPRVATVKSLTTGRLIDDCNRNGWGCLAYIGGFLSGFNTAVVTFSVDDSKMIFCLPTKATNSQIAKAVVRFAETHPEELKRDPAFQDPGFFLALALEDIYPCPATGTIQH